MVAVAAVAAAAAVYATGTFDDGAPQQTASALPPATAQIKRETLRDTREEDGTLGYGPTTTAASRQQGTVTWLPDSGQQVSRGESLYRIDARPVTLMYGTTPAYRRLAPGMEGRDVEQLERNLKALGYDGFTVDDEYTDGTADAVLDWQDDRNLPETGVVELGQVVFAPDKVRVETLETEVGQPTAPGQKVLTYTGTEKVVTVQLDSEDQRMAREGAKVTVTLPDGKDVKGEVTETATVIVPGDGQNAEPETKVESLIELSGAGKETRGLDQAAVDVTFTASQRKDVLTVPIAALVALREGGFGLQVVEGSATRYVAVETGLFTEGRVEVSGEGLSEGMTVGMPQ
ncbi:peptidoglycan-binding protein [Thermocatellispora tengchongensis]|uniref:peptidoglycan-binding protein n=1 Tax=Thermocatellispora tengchongensis TaxID=1073253 RepID=UPI00336C7823